MVPALKTRVWQRHGQLRIYVSAGELDVGWCDPRSGRFQLNHREMEPEFWAANQAECQRLLRDGRLAGAVLPAAAAATGQQRVAPPEPADMPEPHLPLSPVPPALRPAPPAPRPATASGPTGTRRTAGASGRDDLAGNMPGAAAGARARELRSAHPLITTAARIVGVRTTARSFAIGAKGERAVGRKLNRWAAREGWYVLHAVPVGQRGADIDHVVIGSFGVVTINTKVTRGGVWVGEYGMTVAGQNVDYVRASRAEAGRAHRLLARAAGIDVPVQPAIVFVRPLRFAIRKGGPADVAVLPSPRALRSWLRKQRRRLNPAQIEVVYEAACQPASWKDRTR